MELDTENGLSSQICGMRGNRRSLAVTLYLQAAGNRVQGVRETEYIRATVSSRRKSQTRVTHFEANAWFCLPATYDCGYYGATSAKLTKSQRIRTHEAKRRCRFGQRASTISWEAVGLKSAEPVAQLPQECEENSSGG